MPTTDIFFFHLEDFLQIDDGLAGRQDAAGHARPAFIDAIEFTITEFALNIASGRNGQVDPAEGPMGFCIETRVVFKI